jgi:hypothetical protein
MSASTDRSSAYRVATNFRSSLGLLTTLDRLHERTPSTSELPGWAAPDLLVFLRSVSGQDDDSGEIHVFFDRSLPVGSDGFDAWIAAHPEVRFHDPRPGETWTVAIDRWLRSGPLRSALEDRLAVSARFEETVDRAILAARPDDPDRSA